MNLTLRHLPRLFGALSLSLSGLLPHLAQAQEEPDWYQIEVIIFERTAANGGIESWPRNIQLRYPFNWVELRDPDEPARLLLPDLDLTIAETESADKGEEVEPARDRAPVTVDLSRRPYFRLPAKERSLNRHASSLARQSDYRVLFHQAWRQPGAEQPDAPAVLIRGGELFGNHYELEGSITLSVSRYLHLHTHLWLTDFEPNFGQPPGAWPELPQRPDLQAEVPEREAPVWSDPWRENSGSAWDVSLNEPTSLPDFLGDDFLPRRIVTMTQQRRMRSGELHYIDHPLFGVLVEVTPYERPEEEEEKEEEEAM